MGCCAALLQDDWGMRGCHRDLFGNGPHKGDEFPSDSHHHLIRVFPPCAQLSVAFAEPYVCLPAAILDGVGERTGSGETHSASSIKIAIEPARLHAPSLKTEMG